MPGGFVFVDGGHPSAEGLTRDEVLASVVEPEGPSLLVGREAADRLGMPYGFVAAWITLGVESALEAVGLTAAVSAALSRAGISCNVIAGLRHDHLLVPEERAEEAMTVLQGLSRPNDASAPDRWGDTLPRG